MYAIVQQGTKQLQVEKGKKYEFDCLPGNPGDTVSFDQVLLVVDGEKREFGTPVVKGAVVQGKIVGEVKDKKVIHFRFLKRKDTRKTKGHRQKYTMVEITDIKA